MFGETARVRQWADEHLMVALKKNGPGLIEQIEQEKKALPDDQQSKTLHKLLSHVKHMLLRHWGITPRQNFVYAHLNRVIDEEIVIADAVRPMLH